MTRKASLTLDMLYSIMDKSRQIGVDS